MAHDWRNCLLSVIKYDRHQRLWVYEVRDLKARTWGEGVCMNKYEAQRLASKMAIALTIQFNKELRPW